MATTLFQPSSVSRSIDPGSASQPVICQVLHTLEVGGAEVLAARLARRLQHRFRFVFVCLDQLGTLGLELREEGLVVEVSRRREGLDVGCVLGLVFVGG